MAPGDRVAIHVEAPNAVRWMLAYAAIHRAGAVAVPLNPQLSAPEIERMLSHSGAAAVFAEESLVPRHTVGGPPWWWPCRPAAGPSTPAPRRTRTWASMLDDDATYLQVPRDKGDLADILYTSGTTGHPKAVAVRHDNASLVPFRTPQWTGGAGCTPARPTPSPAWPSCTPR